MRRLTALLPLLLLAACGTDEPAAESAAPAEPRPQSRLEAGVNTARTAEKQLDDAQKQAQERMDAEMRAAGVPVDSAAP